MKLYRFENAPLLKAFSKRPSSDDECDRRHVNERLQMKLHLFKQCLSDNHQLGTCELSEVSLSCFDDKRYIHDIGITNYAYSHSKIE